MSQESSYPWLWDVELDREDFREILLGEHQEADLDWRWAMVRLIEYAPYADIRRLLPDELFLERWPQVAERVRSQTRRQGMDYLYQRLQERRKE